MLPNPNNQPACFGEYTIGVSVAGLVLGDLSGPEVAVPLGCPMVLGASVPEAAVGEDRYFGTFEHYVRASPEPIDRRDIDAVAEAEAVDGLAQGEFRLGVLPAVSAH